jgi:hypothetical protein
MEISNAQSRLPSPGQLSQQIKSSLRIAHLEADTVIAEIDVNIAAFNLDAIDGARQINMAGVTQQGAVGILPGGGKLIEELDGGFGRVGGDFDFALVIRPNGYGGFIVILINGNDFVEIYSEERMLIQRHGGILPKTKKFVHLLLDASLSL